jgi:DNA replication initiation complex subunit (GINS family)
MKNTDSTTQTAAVAEQGAHVAPKKATSKGKASSKKNAPKAKNGTKGQKDAKPASKKASVAKAEASVPREFSKKEIVLDLLRRKSGATMAEIAKATDWQNHSIRGFISGNIGKKMGLTVESSKNDAGERTYRIAK